MNYVILHEIPGRMRVHCTNLHLHRDCSLLLDRWVERHEPLLAASVSTRTGNLVIRHSRRLPRADLLAMLDGLELFGVAKVAGRRPDPCGILVGIVGKACARDAAKAALRAVLPPGVGRLVTGWRLAKRGVGLVCAAREQGGWPLALAVARELLFLLCGSSFLFRLAFAFGRAMLELDRHAAADPCEPRGENGGAAIAVSARIVGGDEPAAAGVLSGGGMTLPA